MAESMVILTEISIEEKELKSFLRRKSPVDSSLKNIDFFASLLYGCEAKTGNVFLFHYDNGRLFTCYWQDFPSSDKIKRYLTTLSVLSDYTQEAVRVFKSNSSAELLDVYILQNQQEPQNILNEKNNMQLKNELHRLTDKFWSFADANSFLKPQKALRKQNYFYKPLKTAYKRYLKYIQKLQKPEKIKTATRENPFYYDFDTGFFTYDLKLFYNDGGKILKISGADPFTFGLKGFPMDKNSYFEYQLKVKRTSKKHPEDYELTPYFRVHPNIDPQTFNYVKNRTDTIYWKDKYNVYVRKAEPLNDIFYNHRLVPIDGAHSKSFSGLDFGYGKDKNRLYYFDKPLPVDVENFSLDNTGFLRDDKFVYHYGVQLPLDGASFSVVATENKLNPFLGPFILQDKNGHYSYSFDTKKLKKL